MNVLVAAVGTKDCPAARALLTEGVRCDVVLMHDELDYGRALAETWCKGEGFVVLEHDVVPWPGAIGAVLACRELWCVYQYPFSPGGYGHALGCLRVSAELVQSDLDLPEMWEGVAWNQLDAAVYRALSSASGIGTPHFHSPPLAHCKYHGVLG